MTQNKVPDAPDSWMFPVTILFAVATITVWLCLFIQFVVLNNEREHIAEVHQWHSVLAQTYGRNIVSVNGNEAYATYELDGVTHHTVIVWPCYVANSETPPSGTTVQVYANNKGEVYCNLADDSPVPRAGVNPGLAALAAFGCGPVGVVGALLGMLVGSVTWTLGWAIGRCFGPGKAHGNP